MAASRASRVRLMTDEIANLTQRQSMGLGLLDETDAIDCSAVIFAKPARCAMRPWKQSLALVIAKRVAAETAGGGQLPDSQRSRCHDRDAFSRPRRSTAAITSAKQQAPRGFRISQAHRRA